MKRQTITILGILTIVLAGLAGIAVPAKVFQMQERELLWNVKKVPFEMMESKEYGGKLVLKEAEYKKIIHSMDGGGTTYYHEPMPDQLNMEKALDCSMQAIKKLLGRESLSVDNFIHIKAVLQTKMEHYKQNPHYSYWNIQMSNENEKIHVWLNSVSGVILRLDVSLYEEGDIQSVDLQSLLKEYISYSGFSFQGQLKERKISYGSSFECYYQGKYFDSVAAKYLSVSPENLHNQYVQVVLGLEQGSKK